MWVSQKVSEHIKDHINIASSKNFIKRIAKDKVSHMSALFFNLCRVLYY